MAVIYGFFLSVIFYREIKLSQIPEILWKSAVISGIAKVPISSVIKPIAPYILTMIAFLLVVTYVPWFSLVLPKIFMGY